MTSRRIRAIAVLALAMCAASAAPPGRQSDDDESQWGSYGGDPGGNRHSPLTQINRQNVGKLKIAWTYRTGELGADFARADTLTFEATPILVRDSLYLSTRDEHRDRARSGHRPATLALRPEDRSCAALFGSDLARRVVVDRRVRRADRCLRPSHHRGHARCAVDRARRPHRAAVPRLRQRRQGGSERRRTQRLGRQLPRDLAAGDLSEHRHRRLRDRRQRRRRNAARHRARIRRAQRQAAVVLGSDSDVRRRKRRVAAGNRSRRSGRARRTRGRCCRSMPAAAWCSSPRAPRAPTTSAASASATTGMRTRWSPCTPIPARWPGIASSFITTCGTTTCRRSRC